MSNDGTQQNVQVCVQPVPSVAHGGSAAPDGDDVEEEGGGEGVRDPQLREDALKRCFEALDRDKSGTIDFKELKQYLFKTGVNISQIEAKADELLKKMDVNNDSQIDVTEFTFMMDAILSDRSDEDLEVWVAEVVFTATSRNVVGFGNSLGEVLESLDLTADQMEALRGCFRALDRDQSGFVELPELRVLLGKSVSGTFVVYASGGGVATRQGMCVRVYGPQRIRTAHARRTHCLAAHVCPPGPWPWPANCIQHWGCS